MTACVDSPRIETARLLLTPYEESDAEALMANAGQPEVARMLETIPLPFTRADALHRIARRRCNAERFTLAIREKAGGRMIGEVAAGPGCEGGNPGLGYHLNPEFWGQGLVSEAVGAALGHGFDTLGWPVIDADVFDDNPASVRILRKFAFQPVGVSGCQSAARGEDAAGTAYRLHRCRWATPVLRTARLTLRAPVPEDAAAHQRLLDNFAVSGMLSPVPFPYTAEMSREFLSGSLSAPGDLDFALDAGRGLIGMASLADTGPTERRIGFWLGQPYWQQGLMREATDELLRWAFTDGGIERISSYAFADNEASQALHRALGFTPGESKIHFSKARDAAVEAISYSLTRPAWERRQ